VASSEHMTTSERMTYLVDHDVYNGSVQHAWMSVIMASLVWQAVRSFFACVACNCRLNLTTNTNGKLQYIVFLPTLLVTWSLYHVQQKTK